MNTVSRYVAKRDALIRLVRQFGTDHPLVVARQRNFEKFLAAQQRDANECLAADCDKTGGDYLARFMPPHTDERPFACAWYEAGTPTVMDALVAPRTPWLPITTVPTEMDFILGTWRLENGTREVGELRREGDGWLDIHGSRRDPTGWSPLPDPPSLLQDGPSP